MGWRRPKSGLELRMKEVEDARKAAEADIEKIRTWIGDAREGRVEVVPPEREEAPVLGVERRRARGKFFIWLAILALVLGLAWRCSRP
jgi:hypothetical protein